MRGAGPLATRIYASRTVCGERAITFRLRVVGPQEAKHEGRKRGILGFNVGLGRAHRGARGRKKKNKATASGDGDDGDLPH